MKRHPIAMGLILALLSPYILGAILAAVLLWVAAYLLACALDLAAGRNPF